MKTHRAFLLLLGTVLSLSLTVSAQKKKAQATWIDQVVKVKKELRTTLSAAGMPILSEWIRAGQKTTPMQADLTGQEQLVLITSEGPDGNDWDWGAWANARLFKADGSFVWLDEIEPAYSHTGSGDIKKNTDLYGNPLVINGQKYDHGIVSHANGVIVYPLDKKYVRFETEVGICDQSKVGSVYFRIQNVYPREAVAKLFAAYPEQLGAVSSNLGELENWLATADASAERDLILTIAGRLKDAAYFQREVKRIEGEQDIDQQIRSYLSYLLYCPSHAE
jgi:hypothetical protein